MSLLSLLFALAVERSMPSKVWQFSFYFKEFLALAKTTKLLKTPLDNPVTCLSFILLPTIAMLLLEWCVGDSIFQLLLSCAVLLICVGCHFSRNIYKAYLQAAFRGEMTTCDLHYQQLIQDKNLPDIGVGKVLIWINFRYYIAIMLAFVCFGLPAVVFYRTLLSVINFHSTEQDEIDHGLKQKLAALLFWIEWPAVRIVSFCYMLVGNFSKALPTWLESCFDFTKPPYQVLSEVAKKSEDFQLDEEDCTAEPCLMVRLAKRSLLLILSVVAVLTITGAIH